jgi:D-alanyl-lipoteichoic acid acyltransferase DltB (MBOAT superfamily)
MLFNSYTYLLIFLPVVFVIYHLLNNLKLKNSPKIFLIIASLIFYTYLDFSNFIIIFISILLNYIGYILIKKNRNKSTLVFFIIINLIILAYYKYYDFILSNIFFLHKENYIQKGTIIPLAISFFTFQQLAFLVGVYKKSFSKVNLADYVLFIIFFPQLIAGPILNYKDTYYQFSSFVLKKINLQNVRNGLILISFGLFKKVIIADYFLIVVNNLYNNVESLNFFSSWVASLSYTFQIYFDFSGYIDIAIGSALLFNIILPINFNSPYKSTNVREFWNRWHITLSNFLKNHVYIPMGGNRISSTATSRNLLITFVIGGLWHGAGWNFVIWGFLHAVALIVVNFFNKINIKLNTFVAWFVTFNFINISWIFFRIDNYKDAFLVLKKMFTLEKIILPTFVKNYFKKDFIEYGNVFNNIEDINKTFIFLFTSFIIVIFLSNNNQYIKNKKNKLNIAFIAGLAFIISIIGINKTSAFIYFNF